jgi:hypothetical protein
MCIQQWNNPNGDKPVDRVRIEVVLRPDVPIVLSITGMRACPNP